MISVLYVLTKPELGGAQMHVLSLLEGIDKSRFTAHLFTAREGVLAGRLDRVPGIRVHYSSFLDRQISPLKDILAFGELYAYIKKYKIDVVHTHSSKAGVLGRLAAWLAGVKLIVHTVHGWSFHDQQPKICHSMTVVLERVWARFTHVLVVVSSREQAQGVAFGIKPVCAYVLIRCGLRRVDYQDALGHRQRVRESFGIDPASPVVGMVSCFKPQKDVMSFLRMACDLKQEIKGVRFLVVGDGPMRAKIVSFLNDNGLASDVILTGWRDDIPRMLAAMDLLVLTSLWEGLPIVVLEAMSVGVAVVATDTGGVRDVIVPGATGDLVSPGDHAAMREKVVDLLKDEVARAQLAAQGFSRVSAKEFSIEETLRRVQAVYARDVERMDTCRSH